MVLYFTAYIKVNSRWIIDLPVKNNHVHRIHIGEDSAGFGDKKKSYIEHKWH